MKKKEYRLNFIWDYDKEEKWLNEEAKNGWRLTKYFFLKYEFESCEPGEYEYKIQLLDENANNPKNRQYFSFLEDMGINIVATWFRWIYLEKRADGEPFEIFSDRNSRLKHMKSVLTFTNTVGGLNAFIGITNVLMAIINTLGGNSYGKINYIGVLNILIAVLSYYGSKRIKEACKDLELTGEVEE
ncbi:MAG: DUF2812 domain-containing protein [Anaerofustis stercorihominis]|nr:DUF2812 domain-containing protein [Anaerofustis stercorihominis]